jgi:hypothetical protein
MEDRDIVFDNGGRTHNKAGSMVKENACANHCGGVNVALKHFRRATLQIKGKVLASRLPQRMREAVRLDRVEALEVKQRLDEPRAGGITIRHCNEIGAESVDDGGSRAAISRYA